MTCASSLFPLLRLHLLVLLTALFCAGCSTTPRPHAFQKRTDALEDVILRTRGDQGQPFTARLNIDGIEQEWTAVSPAEIPLRVCVLEGTITRSGDGVLGFEIVSQNSLVSFGSLHKSLRFRYHARGVEVWSKDRLFGFDMKEASEFP